MGNANLHRRSGNQSNFDGYHAPYFVKAWTGTPPGVASLRCASVIRCNANREPTSIASDIQRRLLDEAITYLIECREAQDKHDRQERKEKLIKNLLSKYLNNNRYDVFYSADNKIHSVDVRTSYIEMRLTVSPTDAVRICKLLSGR